MPAPSAAPPAPLPSNRAASPPSSTWSPSPAALRAVSRIFWLSSFGISFEGTSRVTVA